MSIINLQDFQPPVSGEALAEMARCYQKSLLLARTFELGVVRGHVATGKPARSCTIRKCRR
ncbi:MAG: hypothetical protein ACUVSK_13065, partial [Desulfotomaculales bacterium]